MQRNASVFKDKGIFDLLFLFSQAGIYQEYIASRVDERI